MIISGINPPYQGDSDQRCPYLSLRDDPETALGYPSNWNCCYNVKPIATPNFDHQQNFCLTDKHALCPVLNAEEISSLPKDLRAPRLGGRRKAIRLWIVVAIILLFLIASGLIFSGVWAPSWAKDLPIPDWISRGMPGGTETFTPAPVMEAGISEENNKTETPIPPTEDISFATQTQAPLISHCAHPLETPFGKNRQFLLHQIAGGESMSMLTEAYETTADAIGAVNYFLPSPLWAELVIVIPIATTEVDDLPSFRPVLLNEDNISLEELAENLSISSTELMAFNQIDSSCRSFHGWVLVPAEKITP